MRIKSNLINIECGDCPAICRVAKLTTANPITVTAATVSKSIGNLWFSLNMPVKPLIVSPYEYAYGGYYGLVVVTPPPRSQTFHRSHEDLKNPYQIASIFYM